MTEEQIIRVHCQLCDWTGVLTEMLCAPNPFDSSAIINGCPVCRCAETYARLCDEPGCRRGVEAGTPSVGGARGYAAIGLHFPKTPANVGSVLRAAGIYGAAMVATSGHRYSRAPTDTMKHYRHLPLIQCDDLRSVIPFDCVPVAVDLVDTARSLIGYTHPERAFYVFGPEDGTLGKPTLEWCRDVIYVPTNGCMNLAACVNVVLYDRMAKRLNDPLHQDRGITVCRPQR